MSNAKEEVKALPDKLPDDCSLEHNLERKVQIGKLDRRDYGVLNFA